MSRYVDVDAVIIRIAGQISYEIEAETGNEIDCIDLAEELLNDLPTIKTKQIKYYDEDEKVWKIGEVIVDGEREGE